MTVHPMLTIEDVLVKSFEEELSDKDVRVLLETGASLTDSALKEVDRYSLIFGQSKRTCYIQRLDYDGLDPKEDKDTVFEGGQIIRAVAVKEYLHSQLE